MLLATPVVATVHGPGDQEVRRRARAARRGEGTLWFGNTNCTLGVTIKAFVRVAVDWPADAPGATETLLDTRLRIR